MTQPPSNSTTIRTTARILVAEDHLYSRDALQALLSGIGYTVFTAEDGREAVDIARTKSPDLILMDIMMPKLDGFQVIRALRRSDDTRETPIIAITAMDNADGLASRAGADGFLRKPVDTDSLLHKIDELL